ncbi:MAG: hypothetical protein PHW63_04105 [Alphaproteobacteria bacterium]|nr:hypothetical protein [Alphaproteobacteria bacterium]
MKMFFAVLFAAAIIGGFVGAEILETDFSITGAVIGGIGTGAVLLGLGAYFDAREKKSSEVSPEVRAIFDRMITGKEKPTPRDIQNAKQSYIKAAQPKQTSSKAGENNPFGLETVIKGLMEEDAKAIARGEVPEARLIPHHAIKRDIILTAYTKDFHVAVDHVKRLDWSEGEKQNRLHDIQSDFDKKMYGIKRLKWQELDKIIALMQSTRTDLMEIETEVRAKNIQYKMVDPL